MDCSNSKHPFEFVRENARLWILLQGCQGRVFADRELDIFAGDKRQALTNSSRWLVANKKRPRATKTQPDRYSK